MKCLLLIFITFLLTINGLSNVRSRLKNTVTVSRKHHSHRSQHHHQHQQQHHQQHKSHHKYQPHHFVYDEEHPLIPDDLGEPCNGNGKHGNCMTEDDCSSLNDGRGGEILVQHKCGDDQTRRCCLWWWPLSGEDDGARPCGDSSHGQCIHLQDECESKITETAVECEQDQTCCIIPHQPHKWGPFLMNDGPCYNDLGSGRCMLTNLKCPTSRMVDSPDCPNTKCCLETMFVHDPGQTPHSVNVEQTLDETRIQIGKWESENEKDNAKIESAFPPPIETTEEQDKNDDELVADSLI